MPGDEALPFSLLRWMELSRITPSRQHHGTRVRRWVLSRNYLIKAGDTGININEEPAVRCIAEYDLLSGALLLRLHRFKPGKHLFRAAVYESLYDVANPAHATFLGTPSKIEERLT